MTYISPIDLVPLDTHEQRIRSIQAYPRTLELAISEGGDFYPGLLFITHVGWAFHLATPWRWF